MKSIVFSEFLDMVDEKFSIEMSERLVDEVKPPSGGAYTTVGTYDAQEIVDLESDTRYRNWSSILGKTDFQSPSVSASRNCWTRTTIWKSCSNAVMIPFTRQKKTDETVLLSGKVESEVGKGTTFTIELPVSKAPYLLMLKGYVAE